MVYLQRNSISLMECLENYETFCGCVRNQEGCTLLCKNDQAGKQKSQKRLCKSIVWPRFHVLCGEEFFQEGIYMITEAFLLFISAIVWNSLLLRCGIEDWRKRSSNCNCTGTDHCICDLLDLYDQKI